MTPDIKTLKDTFKIAYDAFYESRKEANLVVDLYHNRQYSQDQINILEQRGQPKETFNVVKTFGRMLLSYYSTVVNTVKVSPEKEDQLTQALVLNDIVDYVIRDNNFQTEGDKIKLDLLLTGLACSYVDVVETGEHDEFGRPKMRIVVNHVPSTEILIDPMSRLSDSSDAAYVHRFKWLSEDTVAKLFGREVVNKLDEYNNFLEVDEAEFEATYKGQFVGKYKLFNNYLIVHSIIVDDNDDTWSIYWSDETILSKQKVTYKGVKNPYRIHKLHITPRAEYYGIFREVVETQHAINQALIKIQTMVNTQKAFIETGAVENIEEFTRQFNRVNAVINVKDLNGIKIENLSKDVVDQYTIIDRAWDRIQKILSINDSFMGMAYASDSGAKVKLQQNSSVVALRYFTTIIEDFYRLLGYDIVSLIQQFYTYHDVLRIVDTEVGFRWVEINKPLTIPQLNPDGTVGEKLLFEEAIDPASGDVLVDEDGDIIMAPIPTQETDISTLKINISVDSIAYNNEQDQAQAMLEQFLSGPAGIMLSQTNPQGYFKAAALAVKNTGMKYSDNIAQILEDAANQMTQQQQQQAMLGQLAGQTPQRIN